MIHEASTSPAAPELQDFQPLRGEEFVLRAERGECRVRLSGVNSLGFRTPAANGGRESYSLLFHAPANVRIEQGTYQLSHASLGSRSIFFVPLGPDRDGLRLEAIFNFV